MGIAIGTVLAFCVGLLALYVHKNRAQAKKILVSFLSVEVLISLQIGFNVLDFYTECVARAGLHHLAFGHYSNVCLGRTKMYV